MLIFEYMQQNVNSPPPWAPFLFQGQDFLEVIDRVTCKIGKEKGVFQRSWLKLYDINYD